MVRQGFEQDFSWLHKIQAAPEVRPTVEEFEDFPGLMDRIVKEGRPAGILKLVHPEGTNPRRVLERLRDLGFQCRQQVLRSSDWKCPEKNPRFYEDTKIWKRAEFESQANSRYQKRFGTLSRVPLRQSEAEYWQEMTGKFTKQADWVEYGNDIEGTAFEDQSAGAVDPVSRSFWNLRALANHETSVLRWVSEDIPGVTSPMLYIGMWGSTFAWHVEDHNLYSINYQHIGAAKTWYGVPASGADRLEQVVMQQLESSAKVGTYKSREDLRKEALKLLLGKATMFSPELLIKAGVPVYRAYQEPGDFIVTFPRAYHGGFGNGYNVGEAVNFALRDWFPYGVDCQKRHRRLQRQNIVNLQELLMSEALEIQKNLGLHGRDFSRVNALERADVTLLRCFVSYMRSHNAQLKLLEAASGSLKFNFLDLAAACTYDCGICNADCYLSTVVPYGGLPQCTGCALSNSTAGSSATVLCHPSLLTLEAVAQDAEQCLRGCVVAPIECFEEAILTVGTPGALHPDYIPVPKPEDEYVWYSIPVDRNSPQGNAANNDTSFQAKLASTRRARGTKLHPRESGGARLDLEQPPTPALMLKGVLDRNQAGTCRSEDLGPSCAGPVLAASECKFVVSPPEVVDVAEPPNPPCRFKRAIYNCEAGNYGPCLRARDVLQVIAGRPLAEPRYIESTLQQIFARGEHVSQQMPKPLHGGLCVKYRNVLLLTRWHVVRIAQALEDDLARSRLKRYCQGVFAEDICVPPVPPRERVEEAEVVVPATPLGTDQSSDQVTASDHRAVGDSRSPSTCPLAQVAVSDEQTEELDELLRDVDSLGPASVVHGGSPALGDPACEDEGTMQGAQSSDSYGQALSTEADPATPDLDLGSLERWLAQREPMGALLFHELCRPSRGTAHSRGQLQRPIADAEDVDLWAPSASNSLSLQFQHSAVPPGNLPLVRSQLPASSRRQQARDMPAESSREGVVAWAPHPAGRTLLKAQPRPRLTCRVVPPQFSQRRLDELRADPLFAVHGDATAQLAPQLADMRRDFVRLTAEGNWEPIEPLPQSSAPQQRVVVAGARPLGRQCERPRPPQPDRGAVHPLRLQGSPKGQSLPCKMNARLLAMMLGCKLAHVRRAPESGLSPAPSAKRSKTDCRWPSASGSQQGARAFQTCPSPPDRGEVPQRVHLAAGRGFDGPSRVNSLHRLLGDPQMHAPRDRCVGSASVLPNESASSSSLVQSCPMAGRMSTLSAVCFEPRQTGFDARLETFCRPQTPASVNRGSIVSALAARAQAHALFPRES